MEGKVVLITGASSGIGAAASRHFATLGCRLALTGRNVDNLTKTAEECKKIRSGVEVMTVVGDLAKEEDVRKVFDATVDRYNEIDVLVNNAGILSMGTVETATLEDFDKSMSVNVRAMFQLTQLSVPYLVKSKGAVVNVSSVTGIRAFPGVLFYCMAKAAVDMFTRCTALDLAAKGVRVNAVNPGVIVTEVHRRAGLSDEQYAAFLEHSKTTHALGRTGEVEEVAKAIAFLASSDSSFTTGVTLPVDGGRHAMCPR
ncbi:3-oxoacyl-[acyl-carrier-protein] reductase FabG-like isoform X1 [Oscarella lobularis]|uniref:3-oxoacyl-[acyl-carrier-protein] reductase FabG-like isoform X1 n=1 Tax=Oscarella lobularis TaxID=121494 RepID=UPI0033131B38